MQHSFGERGEFGAREATKPGSHQPRSHLIIGNFVASVGGNEVVDFVSGVFSGIPLFSDQVDGAHVIGGECETNIGVLGRQRNGPKLWHRIGLTQGESP